MSENFVLSPAARTDARAIAELIDIAGEGIPNLLWEMSKPDDISALDYGESRAARTGVNFCYENATVATVNDTLAGMVLAYPLEAEEVDLDDLPEVVRPLVELEALAPGSFYVNAIGVYEPHRGQGLGGILMAAAEQAAHAAGCAKVSLIVASENRAMHLYERQGYTVVATRPVVPFDGFPHGGDWVLMIKEPVRS